MLESPCIRRYSFTDTPLFRGGDVSSDNPTGADNQQETGNGILRDCTPGLSIGIKPKPMVKVQSDPYGDMRNQAEMSWSLIRALFV
jgi:hypothetical protein